MFTWKKYLLQFGTIACSIHFHYLIVYVYVFSFTCNQTKISFLHFTNWQSWQEIMSIFWYWKICTKKFTNFWWLNLGTESDVSTVWIFYCDKNKCQNSNFNQKRMFTLKILISQKVARLSCFERIRVVQLDCHPAKVQLKQRISTLHPNQCDKNLNLFLIFHVSTNNRTTQRLKYQTCIVMIEILFEGKLTFKNTSLCKLEVLGFSLLYQVHMHT